MNPLTDYHSTPWFWDSSMNLMNQHYYPHHQYPTAYFHVVDRKEGSSQYDEREYLFEKLLTPSDVGKLNRLVIPKQHAERYFPLDAHNCDKGLLLSFEDELHKLWRFRYSYWTSSQSYVLTKGWSRFVKEKKLEAGDVVVFERLRDRLYIGCRRRDSVESLTTVQTANNVDTTLTTNSMYNCTSMSSGNSYTRSPSDHQSPLQQDLSRPAGEEEKLGVAVAPGNLKRLRLFGVNLECSLEPAVEALPSANAYYLDQSMGQFMPTN